MFIQHLLIETLIAREKIKIIHIQQLELSKIQLLIPVRAFSNLSVNPIGNYGGCITPP